MGMEFWGSRRRECRLRKEVCLLDFICRGGERPRNACNTHDGCMCMLE